jgi:hypothetical protein
VVRARPIQICRDGTRDLGVMVIISQRKSGHLVELEVNYCDLIMLTAVLYIPFSPLPALKPKVHQWSFLGGGVLDWHD